MAQHRKRHVTDVTTRAGIDETRWGTSCAFADYDRDGDLDLYVANYVKFDASIPARGATANCRFMATDVFCGPKRLPGDPDVLYRNNGDGTFSDVSTSAGIVDPGYYGFGVVFTDLTGDGWPDIFVANDSVPNLFFRNRGNGTFVEDGLASGTALSGDGRPQAGMGADAGDYNNDGLIDLVVTNFSHDYNTLYEARHALSAAQAGVLNDGKRFLHATMEIGGGLLLEKSSRGAAFGDYDNDGDIDVLVIKMNDRPTLLRNDSPSSNHWITIRLAGTKSNRDGVGARIRVEAGKRVQTSIVRGDGSYLSHSDVRAHFGLAEATRIDRIEIRWPSGLVETATGLAANQFYVAREGSGVAVERGGLATAAYLFCAWRTIS